MSLDSAEVLRVIVDCFSVANANLLKQTRGGQRVAAIGEDCAAGVAQPPGSLRAVLPFWHCCQRIGSQFQTGQEAGVTPAAAALHKIHRGLRRNKASTGLRAGISFWN
jgi:hypothetical protein